MSSENTEATALNRRDVLKTMGAASAVAAVPSTVTAAAGHSSTAQTGDFGLEVLSSRPDQVSGGDALVEVGLPSDTGLDEVTILRNDADVTGQFSSHPDRNSVTGVVDGLAEGENAVAVEHDGEQVLEEAVVNHPEIGPIFSGPNQQPFACTADEALDTQLLVDTEEESGIPVEEDGEVIGYSTHCRVEDQVDYVYRTTSGEMNPFDPTAGVPDDAATAEVEGEEVPYLVRWERGTINRFIYSIAILDPELAGGEAPGEYEPDTGWNGKLIYNFQGGVGIGHTQAEPSEERMLRDLALSQGYAVVYSSGNRTGEHYNLQVGGETALMVKEEFIIRYGEPEYTIGLGGSGGGIQQYVYGQNHPELIDGAIPRVSYPDMVTQTIHIGDCELLEYFMDRLDVGNELWDTWENRSWLIGLNAEDDVENPITGEPGATECTESWRGLTPLTLNPHFGSESNWDRLSEEARTEIERTHWDDLRNVYGSNEEGFARRTWDNVGVQYGLQALKDGNIEPETFLSLNEQAGGWNPTSEMVQAGFPFVSDGEFDPWSARNMTHGGEPQPPEPRVNGDMPAMTAAYEEGIVFRGEIDIPIIDWRPYMEEKLDMHNTHQSFAARQRIIDQRGDDGVTTEGHVVWFTDADGSLVERALDVMDEWLANLQANPDASLGQARPEAAVDACFENDGQDESDRIAAGEGVWDGILDEENCCGECAETYPTYTTSRIEAGGPITGDVFKCQLQSVEAAVENGLYGDVDLSEADIVRLKRMFPDGICDYDRPDAGRPHPSGLPLGVWNSVAEGEAVITGEELAAAEAAHRARSDLERVAQPLSDADWSRLQSWAEDNREGAVPPVPAAFTLDGFSPTEASIGAGETVDVSATVENVGDQQGTKAVELRLDQQTVASEERTLAPGQSESVTFADVDSIATLATGPHTVAIATPDRELSGRLLVQDDSESGGFVIESVDPESATLGPGETVTLTADVRNTGDESGTVRVELRVGGIPFEDKELDIEAGAVATVSFPDLEPASVLDPGEYEPIIWTEDDEEPVTLTITDDSGGDDGTGNGGDDGTGDGGDDGTGDGGDDGTGDGGDDGTGDGGDDDGNETDDGDGGDGSGPGFGVGTAIATLGGLGYMVKRRLGDESGPDE